MTKAETPVRQARVAGWSWTHATVVAVAALLVLRSWSLTPAAAAPVQFARSACCGGILVAAGQEEKLALGRQGCQFVRPGQGQLETRHHLVNVGYYSARLRPRFAGRGAS